MHSFKVELDQEDPLFLLLSWDGKLWKRLYKYLFFRKLKPLFSAKSFEEAKSLFEEIEWKVAKSFAVNSLARRALLSSEIVKKMREKGFSESVILKTVEFCQKIGAIEDFQVLENRINKEFRKGRGLMYAKAKWQRSVGDEAIEWESAEKRNLEKEAATQLIQKKGKKKDPFLFLLRRGFRTEIIKEVLNSKIE
jgi:SOS response regulatory protein OraA/RecX